MVTLRVFLLFELWVAFGDSPFFSSVEGCAVGTLEDDAPPGSEEATLVGFVTEELLEEEEPITAIVPTITMTSNSSPAHPRQPTSA